MLNLGLLHSLRAQNENDILEGFNDDLNSSNDIFSDFGEEIENKQIQEEERFYRYGRFVSFTMGLGLTTFSGNRGKAYNDNHPTFSFGIIYFADFRNAFNLGMEYSKHTMLIDSPVEINDDSENPIGAVDITFLRPFMAYRYYIDTTDLGTVITFANPYLIARLEYWYQRNKFREYNDGQMQKGGGLGLGAGGGLEIPVDLEKSFLGIQFLIHQVNLFDKDTKSFRSTPSSTDPTFCETNRCYGFDNLKGIGYSFMTSYLISW